MMLSLLDALSLLSLTRFLLSSICFMMSSMCFLLS